MASLDAEQMDLIQWSKYQILLLTKDDKSNPHLLFNACII